MKQATLKKISGAAYRFVVITARFNPKITGSLLNGCLKALKEAGVKKSRIAQIEVPGAFELPWAAKAAAINRKYDAVICLGAIIKGETDHYHYVATETARGISEVGRQTNIPVIFGVLTCDNLAQAMARSTGETNKGYEAGWAAVEMARLKAKIKS
ncbi:MAG: 6,7-dimethyl-8-ribityllumazine synthase [Patescibacteria group bacterium]|nr:6,7-dimethyl-8-ribityllumazine synthase [Patescibacteria group bacterium]